MPRETAPSTRGPSARSLGTVGLDLKVNPGRGVFDLAVDPGTQFSFFQGPIIYLHAFNFGIGVNYGAVPSYDDHRAPM
ncbi:hypothetical protein [Sorangium sp. So ce861]|uniref:hypothetical protein n=1 Tax=Sorangium sp. So ce861 TaxID=3133323 RepID=UPI003F60DDAF